jgi:Uma2 family endonuclease
MATKTQLLTVADVQRLPPDRNWELVDGVLIDMPPANARHGGIAMNVGFLLSSHVRPRRLGWVSAEVGFIIRRHPDAIRAPNVAFIRAERMPPTGPPERFWEISPDLVVEIISPDDRPGEIQAKLREWIEAGVRLVWVLYPRTRTAVVVHSLLEREELAGDDQIDGGDVLPGFSCRVADFFQ